MALWDSTSRDPHDPSRTGIVFKSPHEPLSSAMKDSSVWKAFQDSGEVTEELKSWMHAHLGENTLFNVKDMELPPDPKN